MRPAKEPTAEEIEQAAQMCVTAFRNGRTISAFISSLQVVRNWDKPTCQQIQKRAEQLMKRRRK